MRNGEPTWEKKVVWLNRSPSEDARKELAVVYVVLSPQPVFLILQVRERQMLTLPP